jgi:hypothetical protein
LQQLLSFLYPTELFSVKENEPLLRFVLRIKSFFSSFLEERIWYPCRSFIPVSLKDPVQIDTNGMKWNVT